MFKNIAVLGAGTMGHGIAQLFAYNGLNVSVYDPSQAAIETARRKVNRNLELLRQEAGDEGAPAAEHTESRIGYTTDLAAALREAEVIIEAAPEALDLKRELYRQMAPFVKPEAIVASNTSTYSLETLAQGQPFAQRMVIAHFFNPAHLVPLVEIVGLPETQPEIAERLAELLTACGKVPIVLKKDIPGFIANRLQAAVVREACHLLQSGVADAEQIDLAVKEGPGLRWAISGPFEIADYGGLDVWEKVTGNLFPQLGVEVKAPGLIRDRVTNGRLGVKSGSGFYEYGEPGQREKLAEERDLKLIRVRLAAAKRGRKR